MHLPKQFDRILCQYRIAADKDCPFDIRLSNQQTVKWILVMCGQVLRCQNVRQYDGQHSDAVNLLLICNHLCQGQTEFQLAQLELICISQTLATLRIRD